MAEPISTPVRDIKPASYNPRSISESALAGLVESIRKFGMPQPLVVNRTTGNLVSGHQRLRAAEVLGWDTVPVVYVELDLPAEKALNVTLNNKAVGGDFNSAIESVLADIELSLGDEFMRSLRLDEISVPELDFDEPKDKQGSKELDESEFSTFDHLCPKCGFEFDA